MSPWWVAQSGRDIRRYESRLCAAAIKSPERLPDVRHAAHTALSATEAVVLALIAPGNVTPSDIFPGHLKTNTRRVFDYWEVGQMLDELAQAPEPAVLGLAEGPFTSAMHRAVERHTRYHHSRLSLTDLGRRLVEGRDEISRHRPIRRWWGGTLLTRDALWRWDTETGHLVAPR